MHRRLTALSLALVLLVVAAGCGSSSDGNDAAAAGGATGTDADRTAFTANQLDGTPFDAGTLAGQARVLWFWAPWCTTCRAEAPNVVATAEAYDGRVAFVGVAGRGEVPEMEAFVSDTGTEGLTHVADPDGVIWASFEVPTQPSFAFIDADGEVTVHIGALGRDGLDAQVARLLAT